MTPRRLTFQLTPLLDLLLIVIFAQFMDVRETTQKQETVSARQLQSTQGELEIARHELQQLEKDLKQKKKQFAELEQQNERVLQNQEALRTERDAATKQRNAIAGLFPDMFNVDEETLQKFIRQREAEGVRMTDEQIKQLRADFRKLAGYSPQEAVEHLMTVSEMRKRVDIWRIHVNAKGVIKINAGKNTISFRAETADDFQHEMLERVAGLPQPKGVVVIMLSFGNVKLGIYEEVLAGLRDTTRKLNTLTEDSRFYSAVIGLSDLE